MMRNERFAAGRTDMADEMETSRRCWVLYKVEAMANCVPGTRWTMLRAKESGRGVGVAARKNAWRRGAGPLAGV